MAKHTDSELLDWVSKQLGGALVNDDAGRWAFVFSGIQNVPDFETPIDIQTTFFIEKDEWRESAREAIERAMQEQDG